MLKFFLSQNIPLRSILGITISAFSALGTVQPAVAAEKISAVFGPVKLSVTVTDLEIYADRGEITDGFRPYAKAATPEQLAELRNILQQRADISPAVISHLVYTPTGEVLLRRLGSVLKTGAGHNGFYALRAAFVHAAASEDGLTVISWLRAFPVDEIQVDVDTVLEIAEEAGNLFFYQRQQLVEAMREAAAQEAAQVQVNYASLPDLRQPGHFSWQIQEFDWVDRSRNRPIPTTIYWPDRPNPTPLVVISHGIGGTREDFAYLAEHLASYGFVVAVPEHVGSNIELVRDVFQGLALPEPREAIDRPLDITYILDQLEHQVLQEPGGSERLQLDRVGVIGQSFGAYTALTLGGAAINTESLATECTKPEPNNTSLNISLLLQCRIYSLFAPEPTPDAHRQGNIYGSALPPQNPSQGELRVSYRDDRVKAVFAINPFTSSIFGQAGLAQIQVPVMFISGGSDFVVPPGPEQFYPFTWLTTPDRYLVLMENGTHFSTIAAPESGQAAFNLPPAILGPDLHIAQNYAQALSVAFMGRYLTPQPETTPYLAHYLNAAYAQFLSQTEMPLDLVQSLTRSTLDAAIAPPKN